MNEFRLDILRYKEANSIFITHWLIAARHLRNNGEKWWGIVAYLHMLRYKGLRFNDLTTFLRNI